MPFSIYDSIFQMKLISSLHPILHDRSISLLRQFSVTTLAQLLTLKPEKLCSILSLPFSTITQLRMELFRENSSFAVVGLELYQAGLEEEVHVDTGSMSLDKVVGGLQGGLVYEVFGCSGSGKTELCMSAAAACAGGGGGCVYADSKEDFCPVRFADVLARKGGDMLAMHRVQVVSVTTHKALLTAVTRVVEEMENIKLLVVDNITFPMMSLVGNNAVQTAFATGCKVGHLLHKLAKNQGAVVMVVSNLKGGVGENMPALGGIWGRLADVRLYMEQVGEEERVVRVVRGRGVGGECKVRIGDRGIIDCKQVESGT